MHSKELSVLSFGISHIGWWRLLLYISVNENKDALKPHLSTVAQKPEKTCKQRVLAMWTRNTGINAKISVLGYFMGSGLYRAHRTHGLMSLRLSVLLKDTSAATDQAGIRTNILMPPQSGALGPLDHYTPLKMFLSLLHSIIYWCFLSVFRGCDDLLPSSALLSSSLLCPILSRNVASWRSSYMRGKVCLLFPKRGSLPFLGSIRFT